MKLKKPIVVEYLKEHYKDKIGNDPVQLGRLADELIDLNSAIESDVEIFAVCNYYPARLDKGSNYYSIYYPVRIKRNNGKSSLSIKRVFLPFIMMHKHPTDGQFYFKSGAIGSSRLLDATDEVFSAIKNCGGTYIQLDRIL